MKLDLSQYPPQDHILRESPDVQAYELRVRELEAEGMTRSDAQAVADAEILEAAREAGALL